MKDLIVMGAGDLGKDVAWLIERINSVNPTWNLLGFTEVSEEKEFMGYPILGNDEVIQDYEDVYVVCALANLSIKEKIVDFPIPEGPTKANFLFGSKVFFS